MEDLTQRSSQLWFPKPFLGGVVICWWRWVWQTEEDLGGQTGWPFWSLVILKWLSSPCSLGCLQHHLGGVGGCPLCSPFPIHVCLHKTSTRKSVSQGKSAKWLGELWGTDRVHLFVTKCSLPTTVSLWNRSGKSWAQARRLKTDWCSHTCTKPISQQSSNTQCRDSSQIPMWETLSTRQDRLPT